MCCLELIVIVINKMFKEKFSRIDNDFFGVKEYVCELFLERVREYWKDRICYRKKNMVKFIKERLNRN